jgi:hypothetical protein
MIQHIVPPVVRVVEGEQPPQDVLLFPEESAIIVPLHRSGAVTSEQGAPAPALHLRRSGSTMSRFSQGRVGRRCGRRASWAASRTARDTWPLR